MKRALYRILFIFSALLIMLAFTVLSETKWLGGAAVGIGFYLLFFALIKVCGTSERLKSTVLCAADLLFFFP